MPKFLYEDITDKIIGCYYEVYNELGYGFLERVYQNALSWELSKNGFKIISNKRIQVYYKDALVGNYFTDLIVGDKIILEIKACETLIREHEFQLINYLKATEYEVGLLLNFGKKPEIKRKIFENHLK